MSLGDPIPSDGPCQSDMADLKIIELRMQLGFITRPGLRRVCKVGPQTTALWEKRGLKFFNPGTGEAWCTVEHFREFVAQGESFPAVKPKRRKKPK